VLFFDEASLLPEPTDPLWYDYAEPDEAPALWLRMIACIFLGLATVYTTPGSFNDGLKVRIASILRPRQL
jgi:hypothetical protein